MKLKDCDTETILKEFHKFLRENGVYDEFYEEVIRFDNNPTGYISGLFDWELSKKGVGFWGDKYYEYRKVSRITKNSLESYQTYLMDAFDWKNDTNEDPQFWARLDNLWDHKLEEEYEENNKIVNLI